MTGWNTRPPLWDGLGFGGVRRFRMTGGGAGPTPEEIDSRRFSAYCVKEELKEERIHIPTPRDSSAPPEV
jgi:hypothetical protein